ncbi:MAG: hypothetical protein JWM82_1629, partial [Myxococcales bacterium]|nr:hypothetical protein [Myxococcales bacterium]
MNRLPLGKTLLFLVIPFVLVASATRDASGNQAGIGGSLGGSGGSVAGGGGSGGSGGAAGSGAGGYAGQ